MHCTPLEAVRMAPKICCIPRTEVNEGVNSVKEQDFHAEAPIGAMSGFVLFKDR